MRNNMKRSSRDAVIGVGTLIVFIAMVLVAAIASAVIIWTAENLEEDAQRTGAGAREDVTGSFSVKDIEGQVTAGAIDRIYIYIGLYGGSEDADMNEVVVHVLSMPNGAAWVSEDLDYNAAAPGTAVAGTDYGTVAVSNPLGAFPDTLDQQSILRIEIILGGLSSLPTLPPDSNVQLNIFLSKGGPVTIEDVNTPSGYPAAGGIMNIDN